jgi:hypothetical protein
MPTRIVTHVYRPKRAPRKKRAKTAAITGPAIVRHAADPPDDTKAGKAPVIVRAPAVKARPWIDDGQDTSPEVKAFFVRMMRPP